MNSIREVNRYILQQVSNGRIDENTALGIIQKVNGISEKKPIDIAITGVECKFPGAENKYEFWKALNSNSSCSRNFPKNRFDDIKALVNLDGFTNCRGGFLSEIDKFDSTFFRLSPREAALMDPFQRVFLEVAYSAIEDAGYGGEKITNTRTGVYVGLDTSNKFYYLRMSEENDFLNLTGSMNSLIASRLSYIFNLRGPSIVVDTACSSGLVSLHEACLALKNNECEMAIAGGINLIVVPSDGGETSDMTSSDGETRSFDRYGDGFSWGEGVGVVLLKPLEKAIRDNDNIYAVIKGSAINNDGSSNGITAPNPEAQTDVIIRAWKEAGIHPETLSYIESHGTGSDLGDSIEIKGITDAFEKFTDNRQFCAIGSVKGNIGHPIGASGMASLIKVIMGLKSNEIPATLNFSNPNPKINFLRTPVFINTRRREWGKTDKPRRAGINAFGASGTNCHVIIEEANVNQHKTKNLQIAPHILALSAKSVDSLKNLIKSYNTYLNENTDIDIYNLCYTANTGRGHYSHRLTIIFNDYFDLKCKISELISSELASIKIMQVYYGEYKVFGATKKVKALGEITERERRELGEEVQIIIEEFVNNKRSNEKLLNDICRLYVKGAVFDWDALYKGLNLVKISLPTYCFEKVRHWVDITKLKKDELKKDKFNDYYETQWKEEKLLTQKSGYKSEGIMLFKDCIGIGTKLAEVLREKGETVIEVEIGSCYNRFDDYRYTISGSQSDYVRLFSDTKKINFLKIVHLATVQNREEELKSCKQLNEVLELGTYGLFHIIKSISVNGIRNKLEIILISDNVNEVVGNEVMLKPENAALFGFGKVIVLENSTIRCRCIDIDLKIEIDTLVSEISANYSEYHTAYRNGARYVEELKQTQMSNVKDNRLELIEDGLYIITGGAGGIGLEIGKYLVTKKRINLALLGKTKLPEREKWTEILEANTDKDLCRKLKGIKEIEAKGSNVIYCSVDITKQEELDAVITDLRGKYGRVAGVFHCAGIASEKITINKQLDRINSVLSPKIQGTWLIDKLTRSDYPDFFVMCSSINTLLPNVGQADYIAANSYLDAYTEYRSKFGNKTLVINWPLWKETGMGFNLSINDNEYPIKSISTKEAINRLFEILNKEINRVAIFELNRNSKSPISIDIIPVKMNENILGLMQNFYSDSKLNTQGKDYVRIQGREDGQYTEAEHRLAAIWSEIFGVSELNIYDDFYELGGDSIHAIKIANTINKVMKKDIQSTDIFEYLTIYDIAGYLDGVNTTAIETINNNQQINCLEHKMFDLSNAQERFWLLQKFNTDLVVNNLSVTRTLNFEVNIEILNNAMNLLLDRHDALRTVFLENGGVPKQVILPKVDFHIELIDISIHENNLEYIKELIEIEDRKPSDMSKLLLRMKLFKLAEATYCIYFNIHHIIVDGISMGIIERELFQIIDSYTNGIQPNLTPPSIKYVELVMQEKMWLETSKAKEMEKYWLEELALPLPILNISEDFERPKHKTYNSDFIIVNLDNEVMKGLQSLSRKFQSTLHVLILATYFALLNKISNDEDIIVGVPIAQRNNEELDNVVGLLINTISIRIQLTKAATFRELLSIVKEKSIRGYKNSKYPFDLVVSKINPKRDIRRNPVYSTLFQFFDNLQMENENGSAFDLSLQCKAVADTIEARFDFNTDIFKRETVERIGGYFHNIVTQIIENPDMNLSEIDMLTQKEKQRLLVEFNNTKVLYPKEKTIQELFQEQVERTPHSTAIICGENSLTYMELNEKANQLSRTLRREGVGKESIVGVMTVRSIDMLVAIMGVLKTGGAYLPIDPVYPKDRIQYMLEDSSTSMLITQKHLKDKIDFEGKIIEVDSDSWSHEEKSNLDCINTCDSLAYILYTSGSTGKPKGVLIEHKAIHNFFKGMTDTIEFTQDKSILSITTMSFDIFVLETLLPLTRGMRIVVADEKQQIDPEALNELMTKHQVEMMQTTPSRMKLILENKNNVSFLKCIKEIMLGGEAFPVTLLEELKEYTNARIFNMYGPTETTVWSTVKELTFEEKISIGKPIANTQIYILDKNNNIQPTGVVGELCIGGDGLGRGYHNRPELTDEKYVKLPCIGDGKVYKTGDLAKWLPDGNIECLGRVDQQVKIRGYRIELGEIESCMLKHEEVKEAATTAREDAQGNKYLSAYFVSDREMTVNEIKEYMARNLPDYMVPSYFIRMEKLPLTPNGKVDRKALPEPDGNVATGVEYVAPRNEVEMKLQKIWQEVLGVHNLGIDDDFFELGGHSITVIKVEVEMEKNNLQLDHKDIFEYKTIRKLSEFLECKKINSISIGDIEMDKGSTKERRENHTRIAENGKGDIVIVNIEPFNEFFYKSCLFSSLFPIVKYFHKSILPIIANDSIAFKLENGNATEYLSSEYIPYKNVLDVTTQMGINARLEVRNDNIIEDIKKAITMERPVIVWIDCFFESMMEDTFQKKHHPHTLLIYGFNNEKKSFYVIEHRRVDSPLYEKCSIPYNVLLDSYNGYLDNYLKDEKLPTYFELYQQEYLVDSVSKENDVQNCVETYCNNMFENKEKIIESVNKISTFIENFVQVGLVDSMISQALEDYIFGFNDIISSKQIEKDKLEKFFGEECESVRILDEILEKWKMVRSKTAKCLFSNSFSDRNSIEIRRALENLYQLEIQYHNELFQYLS